jgi:hypothetical protein
MDDHMDYALLDAYAWQEAENRLRWMAPELHDEQRHVQAGLEKAATVREGFWLH